MDDRTLRDLLEKVGRGDLPVDEALAFLKGWPSEDMGYAVLDHHRTLRKGFPEVIFAQGKELPEVVSIFDRLAAAGQPVLATRITPEAAAAVLARHPSARHNPRARTVTLAPERGEGVGLVAVLAAGTSDLPVAEEAGETARIMGSRVERFYDVGVAGLHRLFSRDQAVRRARVLVVVAGMDGALPSVVGGLYPMPVIAVPTSVGYGAAFGGLAPLLTMLNSCAPGVAVVNIDNGFGAGYIAHTINNLGEPPS
jgi:hypothetical protein